MVQPTANEQLMLELVNRARLDPAGEAKRLGIKLNQGLSSGTITAAPKQPLAMDMDLLQAARGHSAWMLDHDVFSHTGAGGSDPGSRMADAGYHFTGNWIWGENISWFGTTGTLDLTSMIVNQYERLFDSPEHRENILLGAFRQIGIGQEKGVFDAGTKYHTSMVTQDFARSGSKVYVTGVMYDDKDGNDFYSVGEGDSHIRVKTHGHSTHTLSAGGYQIKAAKGFVKVTFDNDIAFKVATSHGNAKVDLVDGSILDSSASLKILKGVDHARLLGIGNNNLTGSNHGDWLEGNAGDNHLRGRGGADRLDGGKGRDTLIGSAGSDVLNGGEGNDRLDGGGGNNQLTGGGGHDTFIFKDGLAYDVVEDFQVGQDKLDFTDFFASAAQALAAAADDGSGHAVFDLGGGAHVELAGVSVSHLSVSDFI
jgi:Ca2+-binding RTX toxin-like protein